MRGPEGVRKDVVPAGGGGEPRTGRQGQHNAIRWGAMELSLTVSPLGDILTPSKFETDIVQPFGLASIRVRADSAAASYSRNYEAPEAVPEVE